MSEKISPQGRCLCGQVQVRLHDVNPEIGACHCSMCRTWAGGPFIAIDAGANVEVSGSDSVSVFNSSDWAERAFCRHCGTHLYYRLKESNDHHVLAGLFDKDQPLNFETQIFIDEKPAWYSFAENTKNLTGEQVMAMFAGSS